MLRSFIILAVLAMVPLRVHAQIVNFQSLASAPAEEGWSGGFETSLAWETGNTLKLDLVGGGLLRYHEAAHDAFCTLSGEFKTAAAVEMSSKILEHCRYRHAFTDMLALEAYVQHEFDRFRRRETRALSGTGPRLSLSHAVDRDTLAFNCGVSYLLEYEALTEVEGLPDAGATSWTHRLSNYLHIAMGTNDETVVSATFYLQPSFADVRDYRLLGEGVILLRVDEHVSFGPALSIAYDSRPPAAVVPVDTALKALLALHL